MKGFLTHSLGVGVDEAFGVLRAHARSTNRRLTAVAEDVVQGRLTLDPPSSSPT
ncbi:ANTAR domain-containing protein [Kribbella sp. C-35]|uniref:ANTAR domain-containing protein n=1 Tax=Kribbella sp. C-35 TaxID=2789276 RepID=UPI00397A95EA